MSLGTTVLRELAGRVSYGWGMIPVEARIADVGFATSLFPKDNTYLLPLKAAVRRATGVTAGDRVEVELTAQPGPGPPRANTKRGRDCSRPRPVVLQTRGVWIDQG